jgi:hypothetical protein
MAHTVVWFLLCTFCGRHFVSIKSLTIVPSKSSRIATSQLQTPSARFPGTQHGERLSGSDDLRAEPERRIAMIATKCFCARCKKDVNFLPISTAIRLAAISRSTLYYWMEHGWIHWSELRGGHRVICPESLNRALTPVEKLLKKRK